MKEFINDKALPVILNFVNTKPIIALRDGMISTMPFTIIGSIFLLLANLPFKPLSEAIAASGFDAYFNQAFGASFALMAIFAVISIAYSYVKSSGYEGLPAGLIALVVFIMFMTGSVTDNESSVTIGNVINKDWTGGKGMVTAIIVGLVVGAIYSWFLKKDIRIKLPDAVPVNVANSFTALIPATVIIIGSMLVFIFFDKVFNTTFFEFIYNVLQAPLQGITDSLGGAILMAFLVPFFWVFGVHGSTIVSGIMTPILQANSLDNTAIVEAGKELTLANGGHIVTMQFLDQFLVMSGSGITMGLVVYMAFLSRSAQFKQLGRLSIIPAIFNINEPIVFATPIVMNPIMAIPFILTPMMSSVVTYFALYTGLVPLFTAVQVPWTTPAVISGLLVGGWRTALLQLVILIIGFFIYLPFARKMDSINVVTEQGEAA